MPESDNRPLKIFLCHASADKPSVRKIYSYLRSQGMDPWLDSEKLQPGQNWQREIPKALYSSDVIIVFLSSNSITKEGYVQREIKFALDKALEIPDGEIFLIPARLEEVEIPESLRSYQWVDLFQKKKWKKPLMLSLNKRAVDLGLKPLLIPSETQPPVVNFSAQGKEEISVKFSSSKTKDSSSEAKPPTAKLTSYKPTQDQGASSNNQGTLEKLDPTELPSVVHPKKYEFNLPTRAAIPDEKPIEKVSAVRRLKVLISRFIQKIPTLSNSQKVFILGILAIFLVVLGVASFWSFNFPFLIGPAPTASMTPTRVVTPTSSPTLTITPSASQTNSPTPTLARTRTATPTSTPTSTPTPTRTLIQATTKPPRRIPDTPVQPP